MSPALLVALIAVPVVELWVAVEVGRQIGALQTVSLLVLVSLAGGWLLRREGSRAWRHLQEATAAGRAPAREVADGAVVLLAGALLLAPGLVTGAVGLVLLVPPVRAGLRRAVMAWATRRLLSGLIVSPRRGGSERVVEGDVVEGEVVEDP